MCLGHPGDPRIRWRLRSPLRSYFLRDVIFPEGVTRSYWALEQEISTDTSKGYDCISYLTGTGSGANSVYLFSKAGTVDLRCGNFSGNVDIVTGYVAFVDGAAPQILLFKARTHISGYHPNHLSRSCIVYTVACF